MTYITIFLRILWVFTQFEVYRSSSKRM